MELTHEQNVIADQLCEQFGWLTEHELVEVAVAFNFPNISYSGFLLCKHIAQHNSFAEVAQVTRKYLPRVKIRQNPPLDKLNEIIAEAVGFKSSCGFTSSEELDLFCQEKFFSVLQKFEEAVAAGGTTNYGYIKRQNGGMNLRDKIQLLVDSVPAPKLCKAFQKPGWMKPWIKAIDMVTGACEINLWSDGLEEPTINVDRERLLAERAATIKEARAGVAWRREGQREMEAESMKQYAADQKVIDAKLEVQKKKNEEYAKHQKENHKSVEVNSVPVRSANPIARQNEYHSRNDSGYAPEPRNETERAEENSFIWGNGKRPSFY